MLHFKLYKYIHNQSVYPVFPETNWILRGSPWFPIPEPVPVQGDYSSGPNLIKEAPYKQSFLLLVREGKEKDLKHTRSACCLKVEGSYKKDGNKRTIRAWKMFWLEGNKEKTLRLTAKNCLPPPTWMSSSAQDIKKGAQINQYLHLSF